MKLHCHCNSRSIRNIPDVAAAGWPMFLYMAISTFLFALPICLIAGEFGSTFPEHGGRQRLCT